MRVASITLCAALLPAQSPVQQKRKAEITELRATGCVRRATASPCLLLETLDGSTTYSFIVSPKPDLDTVITIQGKSHAGREVCKQGIPIDVADWEPTDQMCAPQPKK